jgi:hypothetical protein
MAVSLLIAPHGEVMRTQNCVGALIAGVTRDGELAPTGCVKSKTGPWYHWYVRDVPEAVTDRVVGVPAVTGPLAG